MTPTATRSTRVRSTTPTRSASVYDYFGYTQNPGSNFVIGTLDGGKRDFQGLEFVFRKRFADRWQMLASYNWNDAKGNTNSDSNADFQGDVVFLDPRAPNQFGTQPGLIIEHLVKGAGSYTFDLRAAARRHVHWNSGHRASRTFAASGRNLPMLVPSAEAFEFAGITERWLAPDSVGSLTNPSWGHARPARAVQPRPGPDTSTTEFFVDLFNVAQQPGRHPQSGPGGRLGRRRRSARTSRG